MPPETAAAERAQQMPQLPEAQKVDRLGRQLESRRTCRAILIAFSALVRSILRILGAKPALIDHATDDLADDLIELFRVLGFRILQPVVAHLRRDMSQLHELVRDRFARATDGRPSGITPGIVGKPTLKKELRQLVEKIFEVQTVEQRASPFGVPRNRHRLVQRFLGAASLNRVVAIQILRCDFRSTPIKPRSSERPILSLA